MIYFQFCGIGQRGIVHAAMQKEAWSKGDGGHWAAGNCALGHRETGHKWGKYEIKRFSLLGKEKV